MGMPELSYASIYVTKLCTVWNGPLRCQGPAVLTFHINYRYDLGLIGGALLDIHDEFGTSEAVEESIVGAAKIGAFFGTFMGGCPFMHAFSPATKCTLESAVSNPGCLAS